MERKLILNLLALILFTAASIALGIGYITMNRTEAVYQDNIVDIQKLLVNKFIHFDAMMRREERPLNKHIKEKLPKLLKDIIASGVSPGKAGADQLKSTARRYHFDEVYLINREGVVINTTFAPDLGLNLKALNNEMAQYLENIYGKGKVFIDRVSVSVKQGTYNKYAYFSPTGADYIFEISVDLDRYIVRTTSQQYRDFLFGDFFIDDMEAMKNLVDLDIFILLDEAQWSLLNKGKKMDPGIARQLRQQNNIVLYDDDLVVSYQKFKPQTPETDYTYYVASRVSYRISELMEYKRDIFWLSIFFLVTASFLAFFFSSRFLKSFLIKPLQTINEGIEKIGDGKHIVHIALTGETELDHIVASINEMQGKIARREKSLLELADSLELRVTTRTEQYRQAKETAETAVKSRDRFLSLLSHDIKSPLAHTKHILALLETGTHDLDAEERREMIKSAERTVAALLTFIDTLFDLSRLQAGYTKIEPRFLQLRRVVATQIDVCASPLKDKGITINNEIPEGVTVFADPVLFGQVLQNLASNGIKFTGSGGTLRVFVPETGSIAIADNGVGIPENRIANLFTPDDVITTAGTEGEQGTGMGLAYSYEIIKAHGGDISVTSAVGEGTTFCITLPGARQTVAIIDDQEAHRLIVKKYLQEIADIDCLEFETAEDALQALGDLRVSLIICDICMPDVDGWSFLSQYQAMQPGSYTPIVLVSADCDGEDESRMREKAIEHGASDFIRKPFIEKNFQARTKRFFG